MQAKTVAEIGTGVGISALYLLEGMASDGVLTTIDPEAEHQRQAKQSFSEAEIAPGRTRTILGRPKEVLPRLADGAYDLVVINDSPGAIPSHLEQAIRLLRHGGLLAITNALWHDAVPDAARRDEPVVQMRSVLTSLREDDRLTVSLISVGQGLLLAARTQ